MVVGESLRPGDLGEVFVSHGFSISWIGPFFIVQNLEEMVLEHMDHVPLQMNLNDIRCILVYVDMFYLLEAVFYV